MSRVTTSGTIFAQNFFIVSKETSPILVTCILGNKEKAYAKDFCQPVQRQQLEEKREQEVGDDLGVCLLNLQAVYILNLPCEVTTLSSLIFSSCQVTCSKRWLRDQSVF